MQTDDMDIVTSVKWVNDGNILAVGLNDGSLQVTAFPMGVKQSQDIAKPFEFNRQHHHFIPVVQLGTS